MNPELIFTSKYMLYTKEFEDNEDNDDDYNYLYTFNLDNEKVTFKSAKTDCDGECECDDECHYVGEVSYHYQNVPDDIDIIQNDIDQICCREDCEYCNKQYIPKNLKIIATSSGSNIYSLLNKIQKENFDKLSKFVEL